MRSVSVLVTDASLDHALCAIRSLGRAGYRVVCGIEKGASRFTTLGRYSRYSSKTVFYESQRSPHAFLNSINRIIERERIDVLLPVSFRTCYVIATHRNELHPDCHILLPPKKTMELAANKGAVLRLLESTGIPTPRSVIVESVELLTEAARSIGYPVVIKGEDGSGVFIVQSEKSLRDLINRNGIGVASYTSQPIVIQQVVYGPGYGYFALYCESKQVASFMHKRTRELPKEGGQCIAAESVYSKRLGTLGKKILDFLEWEGLAMVEFKRCASSGEFYLIEVNPKLWGSLDLAVASGVDFPKLYVEQLLFGGVNPPEYQTGIRFHWPWSRSLRYYRRYPNEIASWFLKDWRVHRHSNIAWSDPIPNLIDLGRTFGSVLFRQPKHKVIRLP